MSVHFTGGDAVLIPHMANSATVTAQVIREEYCENCGAGFVYSVHAMGSGAMITPTWLDLGGGDVAEQIAYSSLGRQMKNRRELVRCPACMKFQPSLIRMKRFHITLCVLAVGVPIFALALWLCVATYMGKGDVESRPYSLLAVAVTGIGTIAAVFVYRALYDPNADRFFPLGGKNAIVGMPREAWLAEKAARRQALGIQPTQQQAGPDTRTVEQKRADAKARRDAEMARISGQARQTPPW